MFSRLMIMATLLWVVIACAPIPTEIRVERTITKGGEVVEKVTVYGSAAPRDSGYTNLDWAGVVKFTMSDSEVAQPDYEALLRRLDNLLCARDPRLCAPQ
jgi:hypothetical protein